jgi:hypothetical protein
MIKMLSTRYAAAVRSALLTAVGLMLMAGTGHADEALEIVIYGATGEVG